MVHFCMCRTVAKEYAPGFLLYWRGILGWMWLSMVSHAGNCDRQGLWCCLLATRG